MRKLPALAAAGGLLIAASAQTDENQGKQNQSPISVDMDTLALSVDEDRLRSLPEEEQAEALATAIEPIVKAVRTCAANGVRRQGFGNVKGSEWHAIECPNLRCRWWTTVGEKEYMGGGISGVNSGRGLLCKRPEADSSILLVGEKATAFEPERDLRFEEQQWPPQERAIGSVENFTFENNPKRRVFLFNYQFEDPYTPPHSFGVGNKQIVAAVFNGALRAIELEMTPPPQMPEDPKELRWE